MVTPEAGWKDQGMTLGCWILTDDPGRGYILMEGNDGWADDFGIALQMIDGYIEFDANAINHGLSDTYIADGQWHAMHVTCEADTARFYIDGDLQQEVTLSGGLDLDAWPILLGTKTLECSTDDGSNSVFEGALSARPLVSPALRRGNAVGHDLWRRNRSLRPGGILATRGKRHRHPRGGGGNRGNTPRDGQPVGGPSGILQARTVVDSSSSRWPHPVRSRHGLGPRARHLRQRMHRNAGPGTMWPWHRLGPGQRGVHHRHPDRQRPRRYCVAAGDVLNLLSTFGTCPPIPEWPDEPTDTTWACGDIVTYFGFDYPTVQIGNQCWFTENLRNTQYANGDDIPGGLDGVAWDTTQEGAWSIYGEGSSDCYGALRRGGEPRLARPTLQL